VPVPLHKHKQGSRGFNQAQIISQELCDFYHLKPPQNLLTRVKNTPSQTEFNRSKRQKNMKKAFQPNLKMKKLILDPKKPIILVDDVLTTGSTLNACARALNRLTKAEIYALTLGH
jgi:ComF family protein